jgi:hypothetical protein
MKMFRQLLGKTAIAACAMVLLFAGSALADTLSFTDGGTATGSFVYDATTNTVVSFDFTTTEGTGGSTFVGTGGVVLDNQDGDEVFAFDAFQSTQNQVDEIDIVVSCGGVANCVTQATDGNSFAITAGPNNYPSATCPNQGTTSLTTGYCIASGQQFNVPECLGSSCQVLLTGNNYITIADPPSPGDTLYTMTLATTPTGTVFSGNGNTGGTVPAPEPSAALMLSLGLCGLFFLRRVRTA